MLIIETNSNGTRIVKMHKDWNPSRVSKAYTPPSKRTPQDKDTARLQTALIGRGYGY